METTTNLHECIISRIEAGTLIDKTPETVIEMIAGYFGKTKSDLKQRTRKAEIVWPRQVSMAALMTECKCNDIGAGAAFILDRTTALHAVKTVSCVAETDKKGRQNLLKMCEILHLYRFKAMIEGIKFHQKIRFE